MIFPKNHPQQLNMNSEMKSGLILLAKYPEGDNVKTRLAEDIGKEKASQYYRQLLEHNLLEVTKLPQSIDILLRLADAQDFEKMQVLLDQLQVSRRIRCMLPSADNITDNLRDAYLELSDQGYRKIGSAATDTRLRVSFLRDLFDTLDETDFIIGTDQEVEGINTFGLLRGRVVNRRFIHQLFSHNTQGMDPYQWTMHLIESKNKSRERNQKPRLEISRITQVIDVDNLNDLNLLEREFS